MTALAREPACNTDAHHLLTVHGVNVQRVCWVDPDSILFISEDGSAMTAWTRLDPATGRISVLVESGFAAAPSNTQPDPHLQGET